MLTPHGEMDILGNPPMLYQLSAQALSKRPKHSDQSPEQPRRGKEEACVNPARGQHSAHTMACPHPRPRRSRWSHLKEPSERAVSSQTWQMTILTAFPTADTAHAGLSNPTQANLCLSHDQTVGPWPWVSAQKKRLAFDATCFIPSLSEK